ncbi:hypothetical protein [Pseudomonas sp. BMS12]|uniref:hypothetical protein n=1 Tax=Pseudomonas sp. BMS12 TaxID=1796033 RepID=UPI000AE73EF6|nr:hypothetical protein [Pseudomonas sp. BMS12]
MESNKTNKPQKTISNRKFSIGITISIAWLLAMTVPLIHQADKLSGLMPNEWGDFFAGVFAPLAFLWLILGYLQQGEELRLSTNTLALQAEELKNSVEQQRALVEVSKEQVAAERLVWERERIVQEDAARPRVILTCRPSFLTASGGRSFSLSISNIGSTISSLVVELVRPNGKAEKIYDAKTLVEGVDATMPFHIQSGETLKNLSIQISCKNRFFQEFTYTYSIEWNGHSTSEIMISQTAS